MGPATRHNCNDDMVKGVTDGIVQVETASGDVLADHLRDLGVRCCFKHGVLFAREKLPCSIPEKFIPQSVLRHLKRLENSNLSETDKRTSRKMCRRYGLLPLGRPVGPMSGLSKADKGVKRVAHRRYMCTWQRRKREMTKLDHS